MSKITNPFFNLPNKKPQTFHVISVPYNPSHVDALCDAFAQMSRELCWMLKSTGHKVYHYGNQLSVDREHPNRGVICDEHISVTTEEHLTEAYPNWREDCGFVDYDEHKNMNAVIYMNEHFNMNTVFELKKRYTPGDIFCYVTSPHHKKIWNEVLDLPVRHVETGVGYYDSYMPYRIFVSSQIQAWHYGYWSNNFDQYQALDDKSKESYPYNANTHVQTAGLPGYDAVIPNACDRSILNFKIGKGDKLLYLGRVAQSKGVRTAVEIAERLQMPLVVAGPGDFEKKLGIKPSRFIEIIGPVGPDQRRDLLADAAALLCPTEGFEALGRIAIEAMMSGTVPIAANVGGFMDTIRSGYNGYRIGMNRVEEGCWAVQNVDKIDPYNLRDFALRYSKEQIALRYDAYFQSLDQAIRHNGEVWEIENSHRAELDSYDYDRKIAWPDNWMIPVDVKEKKDKKNVSE